MENITEENFLLYAAKFYDNPLCESTEEFYDDLKKFKYIKRLLNKYEETGELKERLIINHIVVLNNVFTPAVSTKMLIMRLHDKLHLLKPFLVFLNSMPEQIELNGKTIYNSDIYMDPIIVEKLREI